MKQRLSLPALRFGWALTLLFVVFWTARGFSAEADIAEQLAQLKAVGPKGKGHREAQQAAQALSNGGVDQLTPVLAGMDGANELATNWFRGVVEAIAQKQIAAGQKLPVADLEKFLATTTHSPRARRLAFELIAGVDPAAEARLIPLLLNDPSLELRRDAVAHSAEQAGKIKDKVAAAAAYKQAFAAARDQDQIKELAEKLKSLGEEVDLPAHYGFIVQWNLLAPFDNVNDKGWNIAYPPEAGIDLAAEYEGQKGKIKWLPHTTADANGEVDLNVVLAKHKGAICYAATEFVVDKEQDADFRLGCINATKLWLNGELLAANHVYHAGMNIDQYIAHGKLKAGKNTILLKIAQNEQTEKWAQDWKFQLRVCDSIGTAILSQDRPLGKKLAAVIKLD